MRDKESLFSDEKAKGAFSLFAIISVILALVSIRGEYVHAVLWAIIELLVTPLLIRTGVRVRIIMLTIVSCFVVTVGGVTVTKMFKTTAASSEAVVSTSVEAEMSSMSAELERLKKESEKQSEKESVRESLDAYYTAEYPGETPTNIVEDATDTNEAQQNETPEETTTLSDGKIPTSKNIYTGSDLFWISNDVYYGHVLKTSMNDITIELANGDVVVQPRKSIMTAALYGYNPLAPYYESVRESKDNIQE